MKAHSPHRLPDQGLVPIRTVSSLTGVNSVTLRAWERRYDLIKPVRTPKGHRLYTMADVALIQQVVVLLDNGMSIGQVRRVLEADTTSQELAHEGDRGQALDLWPHYQHQLLQAIAAFDDGVLNDLYTEILSLYPVDIVTSRLIVPLLRELGERWVEGTGSIAEEHFFSVFLRNKLGARFHHNSRAPQGPKLLAACLPGEQHEVGLLLFALAALDRNYSIVLLGSNTPLAELPAVVDRAAVQAIVLAGSANTVAFTEELRPLCQTVTIPVFIGGQVVNHQADVIHAVGAIPLEEDLSLALRRIDRRLARH
ncbi:MAG TPA: MerR family transcriptional regulator [Candidatus Competibacteraceae bacterium]|nr:MerR family transcriptional regulator [Candidatus Competibacteraceae bacterium]HRZ07551.1 MerR family transcriptional regulator [Candidatus Competibacteraceae bacterium]HSA47108.1 MerR family transcriptional regulator [Candidatus Competibacteraceae bacterium]